MLVRGTEAIPGAAETVHRLQAARHQVLFATNNATKTAADLAERFASVLAVRIEPSQIVTSAMAAVALLRGEADRAFVVGEPGLVATLEEAGVEAVSSWQGADAVIVGLDRQISYEKLSGATLALRNGARFVATNTDATFPTPIGQLPGGGSLVAALQTASGVEPEVAGKPHEPMRRLIRERLQHDVVVMVGDRPETDLAMGTAEGWHRVLVLTGVTADPETVSEPYDVAIPSVAHLEAEVERLLT